jgi:hypothetical protein
VIGLSPRIYVLEARFRPLQLPALARCRLGALPMRLPAGASELGLPIPGSSRGIPESVFSHPNFRIRRFQTLQSNRVKPKLSLRSGSSNPPPGLFRDPFSWSVTRACHCGGVPSSRSLPPAIAFGSRLVLWLRLEPSTPEDSARNFLAPSLLVAPQTPISLVRAGAEAASSPTEPASLGLMRTWTAVNADCLL